MDAGFVRPVTQNAGASSGIAGIKAYFVFL
jgi:hypothetical protein